MKIVIKALSKINKNNNNNNKLKQPHLAFRLNATALTKGADTASHWVTEEEGGGAGAGGVDRGRKAPFT